MKVILRESYENLGKTGEVVDVKPGFARNFLVPQGIAYPENRFYRRLFEAERAELVRRDEERLRKANAIAEQGEGKRVEFTMRFGKLGKMFGAITNSDIAEKLAEQGVEVDRRKIYIPDPIKTPGEHAVTVKPHGDVNFDVTVLVHADQVEQELEEISIHELVDPEGYAELQAKRAARRQGKAPAAAEAEAAQAVGGEAPAEGEAAAEGEALVGTDAVDPVVAPGDAAKEPDRPEAKPLEEVPLPEADPEQAESPTAAAEGAGEEGEAEKAESEGGEEKSGEKEE